MGTNSHTAVEAPGCAHCMSCPDPKCPAKRTAQPCVVGLKLSDLRDCVDFWAHYSSINEGAQDEMNQERHDWLAKMDEWAGRNSERS